METLSREKEREKKRKRYLSSRDACLRIQLRVKLMMLYQIEKAFQLTNRASHSGYFACSLDCLWRGKFRLLERLPLAEIVKYAICHQRTHQKVKMFPQKEKSALLTFRKTFFGVFITKMRCCLHIRISVLTKISSFISEERGSRLISSKKSRYKGIGYWHYNRINLGRRTIIKGSTGSVGQGLCGYPGDWGSHWRGTLSTNGEPTPIR